MKNVISVRHVYVRNRGVEEIDGNQQMQLKFVQKQKVFLNMVPYTGLQMVILSSCLILTFSAYP